MNIEISLKSRSHIPDLDHVKLSLGIFIFLGCLMQSFFTSFQDLPLVFVKNTHPNAANLTFGLTLPVALTPAWFLGGQFMNITPNTVLTRGSQILLPIHW